MTVESEENEPNREGFAGEGAGPEPVRVSESLEDTNAEAIAIPGGDLTEALTEALEPDPEDKDKP